TLVQRVNAGAADATETFTRTNLVRGASYTVRVGSFNGATTGNANVTVNFDLPLPLSSTTSENAVIVPFGPTGSSPDVQGGDAFLNFAGDIDYFFFGRDVPLGDQFTIDVSESDFAIDPVAAVYNADTGALVSFSDDEGIGDDAQIVFTPVAGQRYILAVADSGDATGDVAVNVDYGTGTFDGATIGVNSDGDGGSSLGIGVAPGGETFMYQFTSPANADGSLTLTLEVDPTDNGEIYLFDDAGTLLGSSRFGGVGTDEIINVTGLSAGTTYYATVLPQNYDNSGAPGNLTGRVEVDFGVNLTAPPAPGRPNLQAGDDTGISSTDNVTRDNNNLRLDVASPAGQWLRLYRDGVLVAGPFLNNSGTLQIGDNTGPLSNGSYTYRATAALTNTSPESSLSAGLTVVIDRSSPTLQSTQFEFETRQRFLFNYNEPVFGVNPGDVEVGNSDNGISVPGSQIIVSSAGSNTAAWAYVGSTLALPNGNYKAGISGSITDRAGNNVPSDSFAFFALNGDANRDRTVNLSDFLILRANFNTGSIWSEGDFNYDGDV
ncbi:MAG: hypothetical protein AAGK78_08425, partial [Planctomycetota bacterium]